MNRQQHLSKYRSTHPYHLQPVSISWDSPFYSWPLRSKSNGRIFHSELPLFPKMYFSISLHLFSKFPFSLLLTTRPFKFSQMRFPFQECLPNLKPAIYVDSFSNIGSEVIFWARYALYAWTWMPATARPEGSTSLEKLSSQARAAPVEQATDFSCKMFT